MTKNSSENSTLWPHSCKNTQKITQQRHYEAKASFQRYATTSLHASVVKIAEVIVIHKSDKPPEDRTSYTPIALLPIISKQFEKLKLIIEKKQLFGFCKKHSTINQVHRITRNWERIRRETIFLAVNSKSNSVKNALILKEIVV